MKSLATPPQQPQPPVQPQLMEAQLIIQTGLGAGTAYKIMSYHVRLGRGPDNDIVIAHDTKCSRYHAEIVFLPGQGFQIKNISDRNSILVDGQECKSSQLHHNSSFTLGETSFRFTLRPGLKPSLSSTQIYRSRSFSTRQHVPPKKLLRWGVVGVLLLLLWIGLSPSPKPKQKAIQDQIDEEIKTAQSIKEAAEKRRDPLHVANDLGYTQAQEAFVAGFRDYKKGQYERALASFQACVSLAPQHLLCHRYLRLTQRRFDELIQYHIVLGRKYRDQNQYAACRSAFRNVMVMVADSGNKRYQEAKANYEACDAQIEGRF